MATVTTEKLGVRLKGVTIKRATGYNAKFIIDNCIGPGAVVELVRSGDVIPKVLRVVRKAKSGKPDLPKVPFRLDKNGVDAIASQRDSLADDKLVTAFFAKLEIDYIKLGMVQKLADAGFNTIIKIIRMSVDDFLSVEGIKDTMANKLYNSIRTKLSAGVDLALLMEASGKFGPGLGSKRLAGLIELYGARVLTWDQKTPAQIKALAVRAPNFQDKTAQIFATGLPKFFKWLRISRITPVLPKKVKATGSKMTAKAVVFTGFRDKEAERWIVEQGGSISNSVNARTSILVAADVNSGSSKVTKAQSLGVKVLSREQFERLMR